MKDLFDFFFRKGFHKFRNPQVQLVACSFIYFFCLLCSYFILRPLRDEMGIVNGAVNMQWLFTGTFVAMLCIVPIFAILTAKNSIKRVLLFSYSFFIITILIFYALFEVFGIIKPLGIAFFIWLSVFNLFVVSLFWSFMADVFNEGSSKRYFGIIAAGGSLGALTGPAIVNYLSAQFSMGVLLLTATFFMLLALACILLILKLAGSRPHFKETRLKTINWKGLFEGVQTIIRSSYLLKIALFMLLYTSISTILYFEQAHIVENTLTTSIQRLSYFSNIDFTVNAIAIMGQFFLTGSIVQRFGLAKVLASIPFLMGLGLMALGFNSHLWVIALLMVVHRSGNFMLLRPSREMLYTVTSFDEKYNAKNFIDTTVYRGGDTIVGWLFAGLAAMGWGLGSIAFLAIPLAFLWSLTGYRLGKQYQKKENILPLNNTVYENNV